MFKTKTGPEDDILMEKKGLAKNPTMGEKKVFFSPKTFSDFEQSPYGAFFPFHAPKKALFFIFLEFFFKTTILKTLVLFAHLGGGPKKYKGET